MKIEIDIELEELTALAEYMSSEPQRDSKSATVWDAFLEGLRKRFTEVA